MKTAGWALSGISFCIAFAGCATKSDIVSLGDNTYSVTRKGATAFSRDTDAMAAEAKQDAARFCAAQGKQLKVVDVVVDKPFYTTGYANAKVVFRALAAGDPALTDNPVPVPAVSNRAPSATSYAPAPAPAEISEKQAADDLYAALLKLDDLRKKGILTDEEFQSEKKKILSRSK